MAEVARNYGALPAGIYLAFDFGLKRTGVALGNSISQSARALNVIRTDKRQARLAQIQQLVKDWQPSALVVGYPSHPDGQPHEMSRAAMNFARSLQDSLRPTTPVFLCDERYSSSVDGVNDDADSAALILEQAIAGEAWSLLTPQLQAHPQPMLDVTESR